MLNKYIHLTFFFFLLVALSGIFMRMYPYFSNQNIPYENVLHAHSHLALIGWEFLAVFLIFLAIDWKNVAQKKQAISISITLIIVSFLMFISFLMQGYGIFSIIMSTLHIFVEYWAALFIYQQMKNKKSIFNIPNLFINGALCALFLSSIGPYALAFISANGWKDHVSFDMSVYYYLHFQYNGWLTLFLIGIFIFILQMKKIPFNKEQLKLGFWLYFFALFPSYLLSILWVEQFGTFMHILGTIGSIGQWISVIIILFALRKRFIVYKDEFSPLTNVTITISFLLLFMKSTLELGLISPTLAALIYDTRSVIIGYLHLTLLGFISIFILAQFMMLKILSTNMRAIVSFTIFFIGFFIMEILLFLEGLTSWLGHSTIPFYLEGLLVTAVLLAIGVFGLWMSLNKKWQNY